MSSLPSPQLWVNDTPVDVAAFDPNLSLLEFLRQDRALTGTKEGCASGDCGACTVLLRNAGDGRCITVDACITPLGAALGRQVITVEGVGGPRSLHPVQQALVEQHGSQCGYCTPGFVMSLVGAQLRDPPRADAEVSRAERLQAISGNLCRCTGYRPILAAAAQADAALAGSEPGDWIAAIRNRPAGQPAAALPPQYPRPADEAGLQALLAAHPDRRRMPLVAGATDLWLEVSQRYRDFAGFIDVSGVEELRRIEVSDGRLLIGAAVTHDELYDWFGFGAWHCAPVAEVLRRFGSPQIRGRGTLGGNLANGSPIADWPPLLLAVDARVWIGNAAGERRTVELTAFWRGYRETALAPDEYLAAVEIPADVDWSALQAFKISKREDDDISSVLGAFYLQASEGCIRQARVAFGGVAATPVRLPAVEAALAGGPLDDALVAHAGSVLAAELAPLSDVRASAGYRRAVSVNLLRKALDRLRGSGPSTLAEVAGP